MKEAKLTVVTAHQLPTSTLLQLGTIIAEQNVAAILGTHDEAMRARGVIAGTVATLHHILPAAQFNDVMVQWELDLVRVAELLHDAGVQETFPVKTTTS